MAQLPTRHRVSLTTGAAAPHPTPPMIWYPTLGPVGYVGVSIESRPYPIAAREVPTRMKGRKYPNIGTIQERVSLTHTTRDHRLSRAKETLTAKACYHGHGNLREDIWQDVHSTHRWRGAFDGLKPNWEIVSCTDQDSDNEEQC